MPRGQNFENGIFFPPSLLSCGSELSFKGLQALSIRSVVLTDFLLQPSSIRTCSVSFQGILADEF